MKNKIVKIFVIFIICFFINNVIGIQATNAYYYEGIPQGRLEDSTESHISFRDIDVSAEVVSGADSTSDSCSVNRLIGTVLTLIQVFGVFIAFILIIIRVIKHIILSIKKKRVKADNSEEESELEKQIIKNKKGFKWTIIFSFILFCLSGFLGISRNFAKPIIYLYPDEEKKIKVKVSDKNKLVCTYPKYKDGWEVIAKPNGDLVDCATGRNLYALYWEGKNTLKHDFTEGFIVKGEDSIKFLEEKLEVLGLSEREAEEFIVYWLPKLEANKYNFIRFETLENLNKDMSLEINPKPDTLIRVMMIFKGLNIPYEVTEQKLETLERKGFTVVEWGGTEI